MKRRDEVFKEERGPGSRCTGEMAGESECRASRALRGWQSGIF